MASNVALAPRRDALTGRQKVAILLMSVGEDASAEITRNFSQEDVEAISLEIARMGPVDPAVAQSVISEWRNAERGPAPLPSGGLDYARKLLERAFGPARASQMLKRLEAQMDGHGALAHLRGAEPKPLLALLRDEHPQTRALVFSLLDPAQAAGIFRELDATIGGDLVARIARMRKIPAEAMQAVELTFGASGEAAPEAGPPRATGGPEAVADLLNRVGSQTERRLLEAVAASDADLSRRIRELMFVFEDIAKLDPKAIPALIRAVDTKDLALALRAASEPLKALLLGAMSSRARDALLEEMEFSGPVKISEVQKAQAAVVRAVRTLQESGEISLGGDDDQLV